MIRQRWIVWGGIVFSLALVVMLLWRLDWFLFWGALGGLGAGWIIAAAICVVAGIGARALRWNLLAGLPLKNYSHFWRAASLGYLGNLIYPARAGEIVRMAAINRFAKAPPGLAVTSAVMDRVVDGLMLGAMTLWVAGIHSSGTLGRAALISVICVFGAAGLLAMFFVAWGDRWQGALARWSRWLPKSIRDRVLQGYAQALTGARPLRQTRRLLAVGLLAAGIFGLDYAGYWLLFRGFGWSLSFAAAVTVGVYIGAGASLPSAPGYIGIYQVACVLALRLYGVSETQAIAYSIVVQMLAFLIICVQGVGSLFSYGLRFSDLAGATESAAKL